VSLEDGHALGKVCGPGFLSANECFQPWQRRPVTVSGERATGGKSHSASGVVEHPFERLQGTGRPDCGKRFRSRLAQFLGAGRQALGQCRNCTGHAGAARPAHGADGYHRILVRNKLDELVGVRRRYPADSPLHRLTNGNPFDFLDLPKQSCERGTLQLLEQSLALCDRCGRSAIQRLDKLFENARFGKLPAESQKPLAVRIGNVTCTTRSYASLTKEGRDTREGTGYQKLEQQRIQSAAHFLSNAGGTLCLERVEQRIGEAGSYVRRVLAVQFTAKVGDLVFVEEVQCSLEVLHAHYVRRAGGRGLHRAANIRAGRIFGSCV